jgi:hypothetical protein
LSFASASCAVIVTLPPALTVAALDDTRYFAAAPAVKVTVAVLASGLPLSAPLTVALPTVPGAVSVAV